MLVYFVYTSGMGLIPGREATYTAVVATKVEPATREALKQLARSNHRSASAEARIALLRHIDEGAVNGNRGGQHEHNEV